MASPFDFSLTTYEGTVVPALAGSESILKSALEHAGPQLESVVVTSSIVAIINPTEPGHIFTENEFAHVALDTATKNRDEGKPTHPGILYSASKTAAERAVWKFRNEKSVSLLVLVRRCPS
jgi:nucleoside-diphosphate-sugar epimerase